MAPQLQGGLIQGQDPALSRAAGASNVPASSRPTSILASDIEEVLAAGTSVTLRTTDSGATTDNININTALNGGVATAGAKLTFDADDFVRGFSNLTGTAGANYTVLLKIDLIGTVSKVYDATTTASLASGDYRAHGFIQGDSISSVTQTSGSYN